MYLQKGKKTAMATGRKVEDVSRKVAMKKLQEKAARAEKAAQVWNKSSLFEGKIASIENAKVRQNVALGLTNQARFIKGLTESEVSTEFQRMAPTNVMKLIRYTMTNSNRGNVFTEMTMETTNDAIYTMKSYISKPWAGDEDFSNRVDSFPGGGKQDPFGFASGKRNQYANNNELAPKDELRDLYTSKQARLAAELANGLVVARDTIDSDDEALASLFNKIGADAVAIDFRYNKDTGANTIFQYGYIPGYAVIYRGTNPQDVIAWQDSTTYKFWIAPEYKGIKITEIGGVIFIEKGDFTDPAEGAEGATWAELSTPYAEGQTAGINGYGRYASETDEYGTTLGNVELLMEKHSLQPQRTSMGVSWTTLAEITLGATFHTQIDEVLLESASDAIVSQKDLLAFKEAYQLARTNPATYTVTFNANYTGTQEIGGNTVLAKDGYSDNAQTLSSAIDIASAAIYEDRYRGEVNNLIIGLDVAPYIRLNAGFSPKGKQDAVGVYRIGDLDGIPVYKAPIEVLPKNEILATFKNNKVENDVSIIYATLVPFVSKKLEFPTFHTQVGIASYGDRVVMNRPYLARIIVNGLKDVYNAVQ